MNKKIILILTLVFISINAVAETNDILISKEIKRLVIQKPKITIAVMPIQNASLEANTAYYFRERIKSILEYKGYSVIDTNKMDKALYDMGIQNAEQLKLLNIEELKALTSADLLMFGIIETANTQNAVVYNANVYTASLLLKNLEDEVLWYSLSQRAAKRRFAIDPFNILVDFLESRDKDNEYDLEKAMKYIADKTLKSLPDGPQEMIIGDDLLGQAILLK